MPKTTNLIRRAVRIVTLVTMLGFARVAAADTMTLMWDVNPAPDVTGYIVHIGTQSGTYSQSVDVGNVDTFVFSNAVAGQRYYFAVASYAGALVGPLSPEVSGFSNARPVLFNPGNQTSTVGQAVSVLLAGSDPLGDVITYSATGLPPGLIVSPTLGWITGTPTAAGSYSVTATVSDGTLTASQSFTWTIQAANAAPVLTNPGNQTSTAGQAVVLQLQGSDANGQTLTYGASGLPTGLQITLSTGQITGTPTTAGTYSVTATVSDGALSASQSFTWTIQAANVAPVLTNPGNQTSTAGQSVVLQLQGSDANGQTLTYGASGLPTGLQITAGTGQITGTPTTAGTYSVTATVSDGALSASQSFTWTIQAANVAPMLTNPGSQTTTVGQSAVLQLQGSDANGQTLTYGASGLPTGLQITAGTGQITGTPTTAGTYSVTATVSDGALSASQSFTWTIQAANVAPMLTNPGSQTTTVGQSAVLQLQGSDANGQTLTYGASGLPTGLQITAGTGQITGTPTTAGTYSVTATVSDGALSASQSFTWTIQAANVAPMLTNPGSQTTTVGQSAVLQLQGSDANGQTLTYGASGLPTGLQITAGTGQITGTPTTAGTYSVTATVSDGALSASQAFTWTIQAANVAPVLTNPGNQTSTAGQAVVLQLQGSDANGQTLTYGANNLPTGLQITPSTGRIAGTPTATGTYTTTATVSDGALSATQSFTWTIQAVNVAPVLTNPGSQTTTVGQSTVLQLQGSDANGQTLTYVASGLPTGLQVIAGTGQITGTPTTAGTFNVTATVSDGSLSASQSFAWTILNATSNNAPSLSNPGTTRNDVGESVVLQLNGSDSNGDPLTYGAAGLPPGLQLTPSTGRIAGVPTTAGTYSVTVSVSDGALSASQAFSWIIEPANVAPVLTNPGSRTGTVGQAAALQLQGSDANSDPLTYAATGLPAGLQLTASSGAIGGTPTTAGAYSVTVSVSDGVLSASQSFTWTIQAANVAPVLTNPGSQTTTAGQSVALQLQASDSNGQTLTYGASGLPSGLQLTTSTGRIAGTPTTAGTYNVTATVSDGALSAQQAFTWTIQAANVAPVLTNPGSQTTTAGQSIALQLQATDANGQTLTYGASGLPSGLQLTTSTGRIAGTPTTAGTYSVTATVSDGALSAQQAFTWTIQAANVTPVLTNPGSQMTTAGQSVALQLQASDANGQTLTYGASGLPSGLQLTTSTGRIAGTPTTAGTYNVTATVSDGALSAQQSFTWTIQAANVAPVLTNPGSQTTTAGLPVALQLQASDTNGQTLTFAASGLPSGLQLAANTGRISGTPADAGTFQVTVSVSDGALSAQQLFVWTVVAEATVTPPDTSTPDTTASSTVDTTSTGRSASPRPAPSSTAPSSKAYTGTTAVTRPSSGNSPPTATNQRLTGSIGRTRTGAAEAATTSTTDTTVVYTGEAVVRSVASSTPPASSETSYTGSAAMTRQPQSDGTTAMVSIDRPPATRSLASSETTTSTQALTRGGDSTVDGGIVDPTAATGRTTTTAPVSAPAVSIQTPVDRATFAAGNIVMFSAIARDSADGDITSRIVWTSSVDGLIGTGGSVIKVLTNGTHIITASTTDSRGNTRTAQITILIGRP